MKWFITNPKLHGEAFIIGITRKLIINSVNYDNVGTYFCFGSLDTGEEFLDEIQVLVYGM